MILHKIQRTYKKAEKGTVYQMHNDESNNPIKKFLQRFKKEPEGVSKDEIPVCENPNFENFFKSTFRNLNRMISVNFTLIVGNFPLIFLLLALSGYVSITSHAPYWPMFSAIKGVSYIASDPVTSSLMSVFGAQSEISVSTVWTYIAYGLSLLTLVTFGPVNTGVTHILRSLFRGEPIFFWSDFKYAIKRNWKQSIAFGIIDGIMIVMLAYDVIYFNARMHESMMMSIMFFLSIVMAVYYFMMRMYTYLMIITFDLSFGKLIKNSVFFAMLGAKRNIMAVIGVIVIAALEFLLMGIFFPLAMILPFLILFGIISYMCVYCAYPKIKEYMIDGYEAESTDEAEE